MRRITAEDACQALTSRFSSWSFLGIWDRRNKTLGAGRSFVVPSACLAPAVVGGSFLVPPPTPSAEETRRLLSVATRPFALSTPARDAITHLDCCLSPRPRRSSPMSDLSEPSDFALLCSSSHVATRVSHWSPAVPANDPVPVLSDWCVRYLLSSIAIARLPA